MSRNLLGLAVLLALGGPAFSADGPAKLSPVLVKPEKLVLEAGFDAALAKPWQVAKGSWQANDGTLVAKELAADKHAAVLNCQVPNRNSAIQFSFRFDGAQTLHLSLNYAKGHLFRVIVSPDNALIQKDKDKKDPASKSAVLGKVEGKFEQGKWYTALVEMQRDKVVAQFDNGLTIKGSDPTLDVDKPNYRFVMRGDSLQLDNVKIWTVQEDK